MPLKTVVQTDDFEIWLNAYVSIVDALNAHYTIGLDGGDDYDTLAIKDTMRDLMEASLGINKAGIFADPTTDHAYVGQSFDENATFEATVSNYDAVMKFTDGDYYKCTGTEASGHLPAGIAINVSGSAGTVVNCGFVNTGHIHAANQRLYVSTSTPGAITPTAGEKEIGLSMGSGVIFVYPQAGNTELLEKIKTVDAHDSGLDADLLDGQHGSYYQQAITGAATTIDDTDLTASRAMVSDGSGKVAISTITSTELTALSSINSNIQNQLDGKEATITGAATTIDTEDLTASRALVSDGSGKVAVSDITVTELNFLDGVYSNIQTQISARMPLAGGTFSGTVYHADNLVDRPYFKDSAETLYANGSLSGAESISFANGNVQTGTVAAATTITFTNFPATGRAGFLVLRLINGGSYTITWPAALEWTTGSAPELQAAGTDILMIYTETAGTVIYASSVWREA